MNAKVTIIVPAYNCSEYVNRCLDSIFEQSYKNVEIICVDDGSVDDTAAILNEYAKHNRNIYIYNKENGGVSSARNFALDYATGKYILFIDSDDQLINRNYIRDLVENVTPGINMYMAGYRIVLNGNEEDVYINNRGDNLSMFYSDGNLNQLWNKMYLAERIQANALRFDENLVMGEDLIFNLKYLNGRNNIKCLDLIGYKYYVNNNPNRKYSESFCENYCKQLQYILDYLNVDDADEIFWDRIKNEIIRATRTTYLQTKNKKCLEKLLSDENVLTVMDKVTDNCRLNIYRIVVGLKSKYMLGFLFKLEELILHVKAKIYSLP